MLVLTYITFGVPAAVDPFLAKHNTQSSKAIKIAMLLALD